jgi:hypothetical protein
MEWSRIYVDVGSNGEVLAAWVERFTEGGDNQRPAERCTLTSRDCVEFARADLWLLLLDIAIDGPLGYSTRPGWQAPLDARHGPFDLEQF